MSINQNQSSGSTLYPKGYSLKPIYRGISDWSNCRKPGGTLNSTVITKIEGDCCGQKAPVDQRTLHLSNATLFDPEECEGPQLRKFRRLDPHHKDYDNDRVDTDTRKRSLEQYKHHLVFCLGTQMELNSSQLWRSRNLFMRLDTQKLGVLLELVTLCVLLRVMKTDEGDDEKRWSRSYHPNQSEENRDDQTAAVVKSMKKNYSQISDKNIIKTYNSLGCNPPLRSVDEWKPYVRHKEKDTLY